MTKRERAWQPAKYEVHDVGALKALAEGIANESQQKRALRWIITYAADVGNEAFRSDDDGGERETSFALGRQFVGQQINKLINYPPQLLEAMKKNGNRS